MQFSKLHIFLIILLVILWSTVQPRPTDHSSPSSQQNGTASSSAAAITDELKHTCLSEGDVESITDRKYVLIRENWVETAQLLDCKYEGIEPIKGITPVVEYFFSLTDNTQRWNEQKATNSTRATYRTSANKEYLFAVMNPVIEVQQVQMYAQKPPKYIELTYAPVNEDEGALLSKGEQLIEKILEK